MNITLSVDESVVVQARKTARAMGKSLNQLIREYLEQLSTPDDVDQEMELLRELSRKSGGRPGCSGR